MCVCVCVKLKSKLIHNYSASKSQVQELDENERNINTFLSGNNQLHLETNKISFAVVHDFLRQTDRL